MTDKAVDWYVRAIERARGWPNVVQVVRRARASPFVSPPNLRAIELAAAKSPWTAARRRERATAPRAIAAAAEASRNARAVTNRLASLPPAPRTPITGSPENSSSAASNRVRRMLDQLPSAPQTRIAPPPPPPAAWAPSVPYRPHPTPIRSAENLANAIYGNKIWQKMARLPPAPQRA